jgi:hypothetical protein
MREAFEVVINFLSDTRFAEQAGCARKGSDFLVHSDIVRAQSIEMMESKHCI